MENILSKSTDSRVFGKYNHSSTSTGITFSKSLPSFLIYLPLVIPGGYLAGTNWGITGIYVFLITSGWLVGWL
jgi:hypothetical protein